MRPSSSWPRSRDLARSLLVWLLADGALAVNFQSAPSANLDLSQLGRVALAGNFDSLSLYSFIGQGISSLSANGSQSLLSRYPTGAFADLAPTDAYIQSMCSFISSNGNMNGVVVGGNFTSIGSTEVEAAALFNPYTSDIVPLPGLSGQVAAVYCDQPSSTVYVGGSFTGANSSNAVAWISGWTNLPFAGFNGPVSAINKLPNGNIVFGGSFTGTGNLSTPTVPDAQVVNLYSANVTASGATSNHSYDDPADIICKTDTSTAPSSQWLLSDNTPGSWQAVFRFGFEPTKLRLYNTALPGYGTKTWHFTAFPLGGILNFTYHDSNGLQSCTSECPLAQNSSYQDFYFVNTVGMNSFKISITDWYGKGGGLGGIELFQNDIYSFAIDEFNEQPCDGVSKGSNATKTGPWHVSPSLQSNADYLSADLPDGTTSATDLAVTFIPDIKQSGNYSISVFTPGCVPDGTCATRGYVDISGSLGSTSGGSSTDSASKSFSTELSQTNDQIKYDYVYTGYVEASSDNFRPSVTLVPAANQSGPLTVVAQSVRFELISSTGGLNGLFEFNPNKATVDDDFTSSNIDSAGTALNPGAEILSIAIVDGTTYAAGAFSSDTISNVMSIPQNGNATSLARGGLNGAVFDVYQDGNILYMGGNFTETKDRSVQNLTNVAAYSTSNSTWLPLGAGVNGMVDSIVPLALNISNQMVNCIAVSGTFTEINPYEQNLKAFAYNTAVWVPSRNNWLLNLDESSTYISGRLNAFANLPNNGILYAGEVESQALAAIGAAGLSNQNTLQLESLPIVIVPEESTTSALLRRDMAETQVNGVACGLFYVENGLNITVLGGHFEAKATNKSTITDLAFINYTSNAAPVINGLIANSSSANAITTLASHGTTLFAGGSIPRGMIMYDLVAADYSSLQAPGLSGGNQTVNSIAPRPDSTQIWVGGNFVNAGSLPCPALCMYDLNLEQWVAPPGSFATENTVSMLQWAGPTRLILAGDFGSTGPFNVPATIGNYYPASQSYSPFENSGNPENVPGPITAFTATDTSYTSFFAAGVASSDGSAFITRFDGLGNWTTIKGLGSSTVIQGIQVLSVTQSHASSNLVASDQTLLVTGALDIPNFGNASAATFNGTTFSPLVLSSMQDGSPGSLRTLFVENTQNLLVTYQHHLALGFIVLIGLAIALALIFLIVVLGILAERYRRKREGYVPAPTSAVMYEKNKGVIGDIPPERIFEGVTHGEPRPLQI